MLKLKLFILALLLSSAAGSVAYIRYLRSENAGLLQKNNTLSESLRIASVARSKDKAALTRLTEKNATSARAAASAAHSLNEILSRGDWAAQPVPQDVQDALNR